MSEEERNQAMDEELSDSELEDVAGGASSQGATDNRRKGQPYRKPAVVDESVPRGLSDYLPPNQTEGKKG